MSRNRVIYQSEALFVSADVDSTSASEHSELIRVQGANYGFTINRTDVNQFGNLARIDSLVLDPPTVNFDFSYYLTDGYNEGSLGFSTVDTAQFVSGFIEASSGRNFYMVTSDEGQDATTFSASEPYGLIGIGNAFLTDYTVDMSVGSLPTASVSFEASNINSQNGVISNETITGNLPSIKPEDGSIVQGLGIINIPKNTGQNGPTALRPGDIVLEFPGFDGGSAESGTLSTIDGGAGSFHIQSASISIPLSRSPISRLGSKFPYARVVDFPVNATMSVNAILNTVEAGNLANIIAGCGSNKSTKNVSVTLKSCEGEPSMKWTLKGATLDSEGFSSSIGANKSVDLTFGVQIGGVDDIDQGVIFSGAHDFGNRAPSISPIGTQNGNDLEVISLQVNASDPNAEDTLTYSAIDLPPGLSINSSNGLIDGTIDNGANASAPYSSTIQVVDDGVPQLTGERSFVWNVYEVNQAPVIDPILTQNNDEGDVVSLQVVGSDPNGDTLTYSAINLPGGLSINTSNGLIDGTISETASDNTPYTTNITLTDDGFPPLQDTEQFTWNVAFVAEGTQTIIYDDLDAQVTGFAGDIPDSYWSVEGSSTDWQRLEIGSSLVNIGASAFSNNVNLSGALTIPSGVRNIKNSAFQNTKIESLTIESGVTGIQDNAFQGLSSITGDITIPSSVDIIGNGGFYGLGGDHIYIDARELVGNTFGNGTYTGVTLGPNVERIGSACFYNNTPNIQTFTNDTPNLKYIDERAFRFQDGITSFTFNEGLTGIGSLAFDGADSPLMSLTGIILPDSVKSIGSYAFNDCKKVTKLRIGSGVTSIGPGAFGELGNAAAVPNIEVEINCPTGSFESFNYSNKAFAGSKSGIYYVTGAYYQDYTGTLTRNGIGIPAGSEIICYGDGCPVLQTIIYDGADLQVTGFVGDIPDSYWTNEGSPTDWQRLEIGSSVETIGDSAFLSTNALSGTLTIPSSVRNIKDDAFQQTTIQSLIIESGVTGIGERAFSQNQFLSPKMTGDVTIPGSVDVLGIRAFNTCKEIESANINARIIGDYAFDNCTLLDTVTLGPNVESVGQNAFTLTTVSTVTNNSSNLNFIGAYAFNNSDTSGFNFNEGITGIGTLAFQNCNNLTGIDLPDSLLEVGIRAFEKGQDDPNNVKRISFGTGLKVIPQQGFQYCVDSLENDVVIPDNVEYVGANAFFDNRGPGVDVNFYFGTGITGIGNNAFYRSIVAGSGPTELQLPPNIKSIGDNAFYNWQGYPELELPDSLETIGAAAFARCVGLSGITIPSNITSIGTQAFVLGLQNDAAPGGIQVEINCPTGSWVGTQAFVNCGTGTYTITGAYYQDYTGGSWAADQSVVGSTFVSGTY